MIGGKRAAAPGEVEPWSVQPARQPEHAVAPRADPVPHPVDQLAPELYSRPTRSDPLDGPQTEARPTQPECKTLAALTKPCRLGVGNKGAVDLLQGEASSGDSPFHQVVQ